MVLNLFTATLTSLVLCGIMMLLPLIDSASVWYQLAMWPSDSRTLDPLYEIIWPAQSSHSQLHQVQAPLNAPWSAQYTVAQTLGDSLDMPDDLLSLELRQLSELHYMVVVEVEPHFNIVTIAEYVDSVVGAGGVISNHLVHPETSSQPALSKFGNLPLELLDVWRLDLRLDPVMDQSDLLNQTQVLVAHVIGRDLIPYNFFDHRDDSKKRRELHGSSVVTDWLVERENIWIGHALNASSSFKYLRVVGEYALFAEVVHGAEESGESDRSTFGCLRHDSMNEEIEFVLGSWEMSSSQLPSQAYLQARLLHVGAGDRHTIDVSTPVEWSDDWHAHVYRRVDKNGFHRELSTIIQLPADLFNKKIFTLVLLESLPGSLYIDNDEVERLELFGGPRVKALSSMDIEKPASLSAQATLIVHHQQFLNASESNRVVITFPIHLRYQTPQFGADFVNVELPPPLIFIKFENDEAHSVACSRTGSIWPQPFIVEAKLSGQCTGWRRMHSRFENVTLEPTENTPHRPSENVDYRSNGIVVIAMPVGKLEHQHLVSLVTIASTICGAYLVLYVIVHMQTLDDEDIEDEDKNNAKRKQQ